MGSFLLNSQDSTKARIQGVPFFSLSDTGLEGCLAGGEAGEIENLLGQ